MTLWSLQLPKDHRAQAHESEVERFTATARRPKTFCGAPPPPGSACVVWQPGSSRSSFRLAFMAVSRGRRASKGLHRRAGKAACRRPATRHVQRRGPAGRAAEESGARGRDARGARHRYPGQADQARTLARANPAEHSGVAKGTQVVATFESSLQPKRKESRNNIWPWLQKTKQPRQVPRPLNGPRPEFKRTLI